MGPDQAVVLRGTLHNGYGQCKLHGGSTPNQNLHAAKLEAAYNATKVGVVMGLPADDADPLGSLLACIQISAGEVAYCTSRIAELSTDDAVVAYSERAERDGSSESYSETRRTSSSELNIWIRVRHGSMDRLAKYSKMALDAGVAEREIKLVEYLGDGIGNLLKGVLADLGLSEKQQSIAPDVVRRHIEVMAATSPLALAPPLGRGR